MTKVEKKKQDEQIKALLKAHEDDWEDVPIDGADEWYASRTVRKMLLEYREMLEGKK